jgi:hypothetical protein
MSAGGSSELLETHEWCKLLKILYKSLLKSKQTYNNVNITGKKLHYNLLYCLQKAKSKEPALASIHKHGETMPCHYRWTYISEA